MSASYPLVRNLYAFSTRFGVSRRPSRAGSSPRSASSFLISSCILLFYIPLASAQSPDALYADRATPGERAARGGAVVHHARRRTRATSRRRGSSRAPTTGSAGTRPRRSAAASSSAASTPAARPPRCSRTAPRGTSGSPPTWARWPNRSACGRGSSTASRSRRRSRRCCGSTRAFRKAPPTARSAAGISRCRGCSAATASSPKRTCGSR